MTYSIFTLHMIFLEHLSLTTSPFSLHIIDIFHTFRVNLIVLTLTIFEENAENSLTTNEVSLIFEFL